MKGAHRRPLNLKKKFLLLFNFFLTHQLWRYVPHVQVNGSFILGSSNDSIWLAKTKKKKQTSVFVCCTTGWENEDVATASVLLLSEHQLIVTMGNFFHHQHPIYILHGTSENLLLFLSLNNARCFPPHFLLLHNTPFIAFS